MQDERTTFFVLRMILATTVLVVGVVIATWPAVLSPSIDGGDHHAILALVGFLLALVGGRRLGRLLSW